MPKRHGSRTPVALIVLDGWGFRPGREGNAVELAQAPTWERLWARAPRTLLDASGLAVGLPEGQMGNSEVGHLNLGAGRVVPQDIVRISQAITAGAFFDLAPLKDLAAAVQRSHGTLHLLSLLGTGGVHALDQHLLAAVELGRRADIPVAIHAWTDGRDTPPQSALMFMKELLHEVRRNPGAGTRSSRPSSDATMPWIVTSAGTGRGSPTTRWSMERESKRRMRKPRSAAPTKRARPTSSSSH